MGSGGPSYKEEFLYVSMLLPFPYRAPRSPQKPKAVAKYPPLYGSDIYMLRTTAARQNLKSENNVN